MQNVTFYFLQCDICLDTAVEDVASILDSRIKQT